MTYIQARPRKIILRCRALLYPILLEMFACGTCSRETSKLVIEAEQGQSLASERFFDLIPKTCAKEITQIPLLLGHFLDPNIKNTGFSIKDVFLRPYSLPALCPPGPFLITGNQAIDNIEKKWKFDTMPDYFLWYSLDDISQYDFFITDQSGFPVKSQAIKINQEKDSLLVLLPKTKLEKGKTYYLYLVQKNDTEKKTWIQPLALTAGEKA